MGENSGSKSASRSCHPTLFWSIDSAITRGSIPRANFYSQAKREQKVEFFMIFEIR